MNPKRTIQILCRERECVCRECDRACCADCDLVMEKEDVKRAFDEAISCVRACSIFYTGGKEKPRENKREDAEQDEESRLRAWRDNMEKLASDKTVAGTLENMLCTKVYKLDYSCPGCGERLYLVTERMITPGKDGAQYVASCCCPCGFNSPTGRGRTREKAAKAGRKLAKRCAGGKKGKKR